jgi:F-type H+-transporting ATPase subunit b
MPRTASLRAAIIAVLVTTASAARAEGMPQLEFANPLLLAQVVWGAIIFAGFYYAASRMGLPKVGEILAMRESTIGDDLEQARLAKAKAENAMADLNEARRRAYAEGQAALNTAMQRAKSESQIAAARNQALGALRGITIETAEAVIGRVTGRAADHGRVSVAVGDLLAKRGLA